MVMIIKSICGVAAFSSALLAGAARVDDEQAQQPVVSQVAKAAASAEAQAGVAANSFASGLALSSSLKKQHAMAAEAQAEIMQTQMSNKAKEMAAKAKGAEETREKANLAYEKAKKDVEIASQKEAAAIEANKEAEAAQAAASEAKDRQQHVYGKTMGVFKRSEKTMKEATEAKEAALAESQKADKHLADLQDEMHLKVKEATKDHEIAVSAEATYKSAKAKTDDLSKLAKRVSLNKIMTEKIATEASAAAKEVSGEEKKLSEKLQTLSDQKTSTDLAASAALAKADTTEKASTDSTGLAFQTLRKKVSADKEATEDAEVAHMVNSGAAAVTEAAQQGNQQQQQQVQQEQQQQEQPQQQQQQQQQDAAQQ